MAKNALGREIPEYIEGYGRTVPYTGDRRFIEVLQSKRNKFTSNKEITDKVAEDIAAVLKKCQIKDGMTLSFHHHLRDGDYVLNQVMEEVAKQGIKDITIFASSLINVHEPLIEHIKNGVVTGLHTSGLRGSLAKEISYNNILGKPVIFRTHGGRARAIETGEIHIDIAFIAAPACDKMGNMNGKEGKSKFGAMGYPMVDAEYADKVVVVTDNLVPFPLMEPSIDQTKVDYVVVVDEIGDPGKISTGATRMTTNEKDLLIAKYAAEVLKASGYIKEDFSFQAGSGGASLAVIKYLKEYMKEKNITGSFASGGITSVLVELLEEKYFKTLIDTQTFDAESASSLTRNKNHLEMSASMYANPFNKGCVANQLDIMVLSATEVDLDFNVNVLTGSNGVIMGAQGGHPDTADGAKLRVVTAPLIRKTRPIVLEKVTTIVTPGTNIDVVVTDEGIAINPARQDLIKKLRNTDLPIMTIADLHKKAEKIAGKPEGTKYNKDVIVGIVEARDGTIIDVVYQVKKE
ncbi:MAG: citrate lyase subunit alpha [Thermotaleaceae bacterium]